MLEAIQRRVTRGIIGCRGLEYPERLRVLDLFSLDRRRLRGDLIEVYKIFNGMTDLKPEDLFTLSNNPALRGHPLKLAKPRARLNLRAASFSHRVVNNWNELSEMEVLATSLESFKRNLDANWRTHFDSQ